MSPNRQQVSRDSDGGDASAAARTVGNYDPAWYRAAMSRRETWQVLYQRFDVYEYVTSSHWRADRPLSPARKISELLATPFASDARILVTGTVSVSR